MYYLISTWTAEKTVQFRERLASYVRIQSRFIGKTPAYFSLSGNLVMISLMQYRITVGLYSAFLKAKELSHCMKGQFWSTLLFMFYLEAIYLPALQRQVRLWQMNHYVRLGFTQMCLYRFYPPMLIRLANDVETNPGPFFSMDPSKTVQANHSPSMVVLAVRLSQMGLRPLDVGGTEDCFSELYLISYMVLQLIIYKCEQ